MDSMPFCAHEVSLLTDGWLADSYSNHGINYNLPREALCCNLAWRVGVQSVHALAHLVISR